MTSCFSDYVIRQECSGLRQEHSLYLFTSSAQKKERERLCIVRVVFRFEAVITLIAGRNMFLENGFRRGERDDVSLAWVDCSQAFQEGNFELQTSNESDTFIERLADLIESSQVPSSRNYLEIEKFVKY